MPKWTGSWAGGRTYQNKEGEKVYQLERSVSGVRYSIKLEVGSERAALAELALFDRDPVGYRAQVQSAGALQGSAVFLDAETVQGFLLHLAGKERSEGYRRDARTYLSQWAEVLARRDLRTVALLELRRALSKWPTARKMRIITLKSFFTWLREEDRIKASEDPTLALKVPPAVAEKGVRTKGYTMAQVEKLYAAVNSQVVRDVLCLRAKTGMHNSEIERLASGKGELRVINDPSGIAGTARFLHKNGRVHIISLDAQGLAAHNGSRRGERHPAGIPSGSPSGTRRCARASCPSTPASCDTALRRGQKTRARW